MFGRLSYPAHFKKRGLRTAVYPAGLPKNNKGNVDKRLANTSTIFRKDLRAVLELRHSLGRPQGLQSLAPLRTGSFANRRLLKG